MIWVSESDFWVLWHCECHDRVTHDGVCQWHFCRDFTSQWRVVEDEEVMSVMSHVPREQQGYTPDDPYMFPSNQGIFDNILGLWDVKMQILPLTYLMFNFFLLLTTVLLCLVPYVLYHLAQLNFLHFMSILADFWNFSHLCFKKYFPIISCLLTFGIMIH